MNLSKIFAEKALIFFKKVSRSFGYKPLALILGLLFLNFGNASSLNEDPIRCCNIWAVYLSTSIINSNIVSSKDIDKLVEDVIEKWSETSGLKREVVLSYFVPPKGELKEEELDQLYAEYKKNYSEKYKKHEIIYLSILGRGYELKGKNSDIEYLTISMVAEIYGKDKPLVMKLGFPDLIKLTGGKDIDNKNLKDALECKIVPVLFFHAWNKFSSEKGSACESL